MQIQMTNNLKEKRQQSVELFCMGYEHLLRSCYLIKTYVQIKVIFKSTYKWSFITFSPLEIVYI